MSSYPKSSYSSRNSNSGNRSFSSNRGNSSFGRNTSSRFGSGRRSFGKSKGIDFSNYTQAASQKSDEVVNDFTFSSYDLHDKIKSLVAGRGYIKPTEIQEQVIPVVLSGRDVVGLAQTGSGKTASYLIPLLHQTLLKKIDNSDNQTLIIVPTRELAFQVEKELFEFGLKELNFYSVVCVGGMYIRDQIRRLSKPNQFIVGTPGRLIDLAKKGFIKLDKIDSVVVDEVDRMLDMGFIEDITWIMGEIPKTRQGLFFSATFNKSVTPLMDKLSPNSVLVKAQPQKASPFVEQTMVRVQRPNTKIDTLLSIVHEEKELKGLIFVNTKSETEKVAQRFEESGIETLYLHGDKSQSSRMQTIRMYKRMKAGVLVATDVASRGLDIDDITHVFNYDEPDSIETHIHRIGRTGRAGRYGKAVTLVNR
jgi:superfamily II DNA/RNA helicase